MNYKEIFRLSLKRLKQRKFRTFLTSLGVFIGTISIVVLIGFSLGISESLNSSFSKQGLDLIYIQDTGKINDKADSVNEFLTLDTLEELKKIPHVKKVSPMLHVSASFKRGKYEAYQQLEGITQEGFESLNLPMNTKKSLDFNSNELFFVTSEKNFMDKFYDTSNNEYSYSSDKKFDFTIQNKDIFYKLSNQFSEAYIPSSNKNEIGKTIKIKTRIFNLADTFSFPENTYPLEAENVYVPLNALEKALKQDYKQNPLPNQPTNKLGKPFKEMTYSSILIQVDNSKNAIELLDTLKANEKYKDFYISSQAAYLAHLKEDTAKISYILVFIGSLALIVAAVGIMNTMMMSVMERTKEIGIYKVLGCKIQNIRNLFLVEAGLIGLIGGIVGLSVSLMIAEFINKINEHLGSKICFIPWWLSILSLVFAFLIGSISGLIPALRATKISPLTALRGD